jgi:hypothetical protein
MILNPSSVPNLRAFAVAALLLLNGVLFARSEPLLTMPKDAELEGLFRSHRDAFERLAAMGMEDAGTVSHLSVDTLNKEPLADGRQHLPIVRRNEYKRLLSGIRPDLSMGISTNGVSFSYWRDVWSGRSCEKGITYIAYTPERVGRIVNELDKRPAEDDVYLVPIESKWYIIYAQLD